MEVSITFHLQGEPQEIGAVLAQLAETLDGNPAAQAVGQRNGGQQQHDPEWWTPARAEAFVAGLTDPALRALGIIARSAPRVGFPQLQRQMGARGMQLAGRMSSIGFAVARQNAPLPFVRDYYQRAYIMDQRVAAVLGPAAKQEMRRRKASRAAPTTPGRRRARRPPAADEAAEIG